MRVCAADGVETPALSHATTVNVWTPGATSGSQLDSLAGLVIEINGGWLSDCSMSSDGSLDVMSSDS